jgi:hypothetical protein
MKNKILISSISREIKFKNYFNYVLIMSNINNNTYIFYLKNNTRIITQYFFTLTTVLYYVKI